MNQTHPASDKRSLRREYRAARRALDARVRDGHDRAIREHIANSLAIRQAARVAAYWPVDGEPDLRPLLDRLDARGVQVALPVCGRQRALSFREWHRGAPLQPGALAIPVPAGGAELPLDTLDVVLMPLVAWDRSGRRLGMGGGYYDRLFGKRREVETPLRVGVAYDVQRAEVLPADAWDVALHAVVTESGWFTCRG